MDWLPDGWKPKLVAVDIDGTLTDGNKVLNLEAIEALRKLEKAGIPVTLATGNVRLNYVRTLEIHRAFWTDVL